MVQTIEWNGITIVSPTEPECGFEDVKDERTGLWERRWKK